MSIQIWKPGQKIKNDRFEIIKELGKGGFGITYLADDSRRKQRVVIKTLNANQQGEPNFLDTQEKFLNEGFILKSFDHPHIVKVYEPIQIDTLWGLVMEYIPGSDLKDYTSEKGYLSEAEALGYIDQIAQALDCVHRKNFFHRDVKPHNIMLRQQQREAVLIDFGIAREYIDQQTVYLSNSLGTELYKPIEQYEQRGRFGPYTDIYALAVTLYHLLTGQAPGGGSPLYTAKARKDGQERGYGNQIDEYLWGELAKTGISDRTQQAIQAGMQIEPTQRPHTMTEFRELLGLVNKSASAKSKPLPTPTPSPQPLKKFSFETTQIKIVDGFFGQKVKIVKQSKQGEYISEDLGNGVKLEMVSIPAGSFLMGSPVGEGNENEKPQHLVNVPTFYMGKYPITQSQYLAIMGENPSHFQGGDLPVENVSWLNAQEFCEKLSKKSGKKYRLPSEAEWEYACRAGTTTPFHFGETITTDVANFNGDDTYGNAPKGKYLQKTTLVGNYKVANNFGLYDLHGNVCEWCLDEYEDNYQDAPTDGSARENIFSKDKNKKRLLRGGSWKYNPRNCRSAYRNRRSADTRHNYIGFRLVLSQKF